MVPGAQALDTFAEGTKLFKEVFRNYTLAKVDDYFATGKWQIEQLQVDLELLTAHRCEAGAPEPPLMEDLVFPELPQERALLGPRPPSGLPPPAFSARVTSSTASMRRQGVAANGVDSFRHGAPRGRSGVAANAAVGTRRPSAVKNGVGAFGNGAAHAPSKAAAVGSRRPEGVANGAGPSSKGASRGPLATASSRARSWHNDDAGGPAKQQRVGAIGSMPPPRSLATSNARPTTRVAEGGAAGAAKLSAALESQQPGDLIRSLLGKS